MRTINLPLLKTWIEKRDNGVAALAVAAEISPSKVSRILRGEKIPDGPEQKSICEATGLKRDDLFPQIKDNEHAS